MHRIFNGTCTGNGIQRMQHRSLAERDLKQPRRPKRDWKVQTTNGLLLRKTRYCLFPLLETSLKCIKWLWLSSAPIYGDSGDSHARGDTGDDPSRLASPQTATPQIPTDRSPTSLKQSLSRHAAGPPKLSRSCTAGTSKDDFVQSS